MAGDGEGRPLEPRSPTSHRSLIPAEAKQPVTSPLRVGLGSKTEKKTLLGKKMQLPACFPSFPAVYLFMRGQTAIPPVLGTGLSLGRFPFHSLQVHVLDVE